VERIRASLPETPWARVGRYEQLGLDPVAAHRLASAPWADLFDRAISATVSGAPVAPVAPVALARRLAASLAKRIPFHRRSGRRIAAAAGSVLQDALARIAAGDIRPEALDRIVDAAVTRPGTPPEEIVGPYAPPPADVDALLSGAVSRARTMTGRSLATLVRWAMGEVMPRALGQADPQDVRRRLEERLAATVAEAAR
jgi:Glu-tRNA(Gln) amidotransferase subunit E-like FAD-binding protein